jgi:hypothetical protein
MTTQESADRPALYEFGTYKRTERLEALTRLPKDNPEPVTKQDIDILFREYKAGSEDVGAPTNLVEFAAWLLGNRISEVRGQGWYALNPPADVFW